jgi:superoxide dismutase, Fe-Mn family
MPHSLPALPYAYSALEPFFDAQTMEIHHTKHHQAYIDKLNAALTGTPFADLPVEDLLRRFNEVPEDPSTGSGQALRTAVRNHGGGHANHSLFWTILAPPSTDTKPDDALEQALTQAFGSVQDFKVQFSEKATTLFGSGWAWLVVDNGSLKIETTPNQDSPLMQGRTPILGLDVWEHAYYLHYQNKRPEYVAAFWSVVNWNEVARRLAQT